MISRHCSRRARAAMLCTVAMCCVSTLAHAQRASPSVAQIAALQKLEGWVGEWSGTGWSMDQTGRRTEFTRIESVSRRLGGTLFLVEGHATLNGTTAAGNANPGGLALVYFNEHTGRYRWNGHDFAAGTVETDVELVNGGFQWSIRPDTLGTVVRFTILVDDARWHEVGEVSADGQHWNTFMQMDLTRARGKAVPKPGS